MSQALFFAFSLKKKAPDRRYSIVALVYLNLGHQGETYNGESYFVRRQKQTMEGFRKAVLFMSTVVIKMFSQDILGSAQTTTSFPGLSSYRPLEGANRLRLYFCVCSGFVA